MGKLKLIVAVFVAIWLAIVCQWQHSANGRLRRQNESLKAALAELKQQQEVRVPVSADNAQAKEQLAELLRLRGEVTQLRGQTNQIAALTDANEKLRASLSESKIAQTNTSIAPIKKNPEDAL